MKRTHTEEDGSAGLSAGNADTAGIGAYVIAALRHVCGQGLLRTILKLTLIDLVCASSSSSRSS